MTKHFHRSFSTAVLVVAAASCAAFALPVRAEEQPPPPPIGKYVRIPASLTNNDFNRLRQTIDRFAAQVKKTPERRPIVIFEIETGPTTFGLAFDVAKYMSQDIIKHIENVRTVAYVPNSLSGHHVLLALACKEIVMHRDGNNETTQIGNAGASEAVGAVQINGYREIAQAHNTVPVPIALKMLDKSLELLLVKTDLHEGVYVLAESPLPDVDDLESLKARERIGNVTKVADAGREGVFSTAQAQKAGFVGLAAADRGELLHELGLARDALGEDPSLESGWRTARVEIKGVVNKELVDKTMTMIDSQIRDRQVNFLCVWIDSAGGVPSQSMLLAGYLAALDPAKHRTVAYIPQQARGDAAAIALACDQIVMHPRAELGGSGEAAVNNERDIRVIEETYRDLATKKYHSPSLAAAMVNPQVTVYRYTRVDSGQSEFMTEEEATQLPDAEKWQKGEQINKPNENLRLTGERAEQLGVAHNVVRDFGEFKRLYGLEHDPQMIEPGWALWLIDALRAPALKLLLLLIGGAALYAELHTPGIGIGGFVAAVCFLLYFWSGFLGGTAGWLEVLLFGLGVICVLLEIFVFPGTGIFGLGGGLLVIASLVLASQTFVIPHNDYQMESLQSSLMVIVLAIGGSVVCAAAMRRFLPHAPMFNRMLLAPPSGAELSELSRRESLGRFEHLMGSRGTTYTPLVPGGKARIGEQLVDVVSEGEFIDRGASIEVVEIHGTRVVVRQVG